MKKNPTCKRCGGLGHYSINCLRFMPQKKSKPEKKTVKITRAKAKKKAWTAFSSYIRTRDSLATTGTTTHCICITCQERGEGVKKEYKHIQAGHAVGGRGNAVLFHEEIVNGQCSYCNTKPPFGLGGDYGNYAIALIRRYGLNHVNELQRLKGVTKQYKLQDFLEIEEDYKKKLKNLLKNYGQIV